MDEIMTQALVSHYRLQDLFNRLGICNRLSEQAKYEESVFRICGLIKADAELNRRLTLEEANGNN